MDNDPISRVKGLVGETGLLPIRDTTGFRGEVGFTVLSVEPPVETEDNLEGMVNKSRFTVRFDEGTLVDGRVTGIFWGSDFSKLTGVPISGATADES